LTVARTWLPASDDASLTYMTCRRDVHVVQEQMVLFAPFISVPLNCFRSRHSPFLWPLQSSTSSPQFHSNYISWMEDAQCIILKLWLTTCKPRSTHINSPRKSISPDDFASSNQKCQSLWLKHGCVKVSKCHQCDHAIFIIDITLVIVPTGNTAILISRSFIKVCSIQWGLSSLLCGNWWAGPSEKEVLYKRLVVRTIKTN
jgi:hypothetical protein